MVDGLPDVLCMMDDIIIFGDTHEKHDTRVKDVLKRLEENGVTLNFGKCDFANPAFHAWVMWFQLTGSRLTQHMCKR